MLFHTLNYQKHMLSNTLLLIYVVVYCHRNKTPSLDSNKILEIWEVVVRAAKEVGINLKVINSNGNPKVRKAFEELATSKVPKCLL